MQSKDKTRKPVVINKTPVAAKKTAKRKKKSLAYKPKPFLMVLYWVLALLGLFAMYLKGKHFFDNHF
ncbi:MAG: hypothetical protein Q8S01_07315 [Ignavibacteria bacterium]|nr:hypothetical protein [Ignavibacteria bacterium]